MKRLAPLFIACSAFFVPGVAFSEPAPASALMMTLDGSLIMNSSSNFAPALGQIIDSYNDAGPCEGPDWATCDALQFGLAVHSGPTCTDADPLVVMYDPGEDVGIDHIDPRLNGISSEDGGMNPTFCGGNSPNFRNHDTAQAAVWEATFPGTTSATEAQLDAYWERPHLQLFVTDGLPSSANGSADNRVVNTFAQVCEMFEGPAGLPTMPTWVIVERRDNAPETLYGGLLSAAGGTGECEQRVMGAWLPLDVCTHITEPGVTEATIRAGIQNGTYRCDAGSETYKVGSMDYDEASGNQGTPYIKCHLDGYTNCNANQPQTDLFGILSCVRQLPRGITAADAIITYCPPGGAPADCFVLTEANGDFEWIDERKTLFVMTDKDNCTGGGVDVSTCEEGVACDTGLEGRCAAGLTDCSTGTEVCVSVRSAFPEVCNGLDDDCDGEPDNMKQSWEKPEFSALTLPEDRQGIDCNRVNICACLGGETATHQGDTFETFVSSWTDICQCAEGLSPEEYTHHPAPTSESAPEAQASCSSVNPQDGVPAMFLALLALGFAPLLRRRNH